MIAVIAAQLKSKRLHEKVMQNIGGMTMLERVIITTVKSELFEEVIIATPDLKILDSVAFMHKDYPVIKQIKTSENNCNAVEAVAEVAQYYDSNEYFLNVQSDRPLLSVDMLKAMVKARRPDAVTALVGPFKTSNRHDPNRVKCVVNHLGFAIYFSRNMIPFPFLEEGPALLSGGIYGYPQELVLKYKQYGKSELERVEGIDQLRFLDYNIPIFAVFVNEENFGVDSPQDLENVRKICNASNL